jgi:hypothetical protein
MLALRGGGMALPRCPCPTAAVAEDRPGTRPFFRIGRAYSARAQ